VRRAERRRDILDLKLSWLGAVDRLDTFWRQLVVQRSVIFALSAVTFVALVPVACTQDFGSFEPAAGLGGSGSSNGSGSTSTSASSGSDGGKQCSASDMCDDGNACTTDECDRTTRACVHTKLNGSVQAADDKNPCTEDRCNNGAVQHTKEPTGQSCGLDLVCNDAGRCVDCLTEDQCPAAPECQAPTCNNFRCGVENVLVDTTCSTGKCDGNGACVECLGKGDCDNSDVCVDGKCLPDDCKNGNEDDLETDIDCGGPVCAKCATGKACVVNSDCLSNQCTPAKVCG
jgi:hypothetical protein